MAIIGVGFMLRVWAIDFGFHVDEPNIVRRAISMAEGNWYKPWYNWPAQSLMHIYAVIFSVGGWFSDSLPHYPIARLVSVLFDTATIGVVMALVWRLSRSSVAVLVGGSWYAVSWFATEQARYATPDATLTFCLAVTVLLAVLLWQQINTQQQKKLLWASGAVFGFAIATKYTAALLIVPIAAVWVAKKMYATSSGWFYGVGYLVTAVVVHTAFNPFAIFDLDLVQAALAQEANPVRIGRDWAGAFPVFRNLWFYIELISQRTGTVISWLGYGGFMLSGWAVLQQRRNNSTSVGVWIVTLMYLAYWGSISTLGLHWERWGLPLLPLVIVSAAWVWGLLWGWSASRTKPIIWRISLVVCTLLVSLPQVGLSLLQGQAMMQPDTRTLVANYITQHIPPNHDTPVNILGEVEAMELPAGYEYTYKYGGDDAVPNRSLDRYITKGRQYIVLRYNQIQARKLQPNVYTVQNAFAEDIANRATELTTIRRYNNTLLDITSDVEFYSWVAKPLNWSRLWEVNRGEAYIIYQLPSDIDPGWSIHTVGTSWATTPFWNNRSPFSNLFRDVSHNNVGVIFLRSLDNIKCAICATIQHHM